MALFKVITLGLGLAAVAGMASAQESGKPADAEACYGRVYSQSHLQSHPDQKVARIFFYSGKDPVSRPNEEPVNSDADAGYNGFMTTTVRGSAKPEWVSGWCGSFAENSDGEVRCGMECDRTMASLKLDGKDHIIVNDLSRDLYLDIGAEDELGAAEYEKRALGSDDNGFRLERMPARSCVAEFARIDPVDPSLGEPLRERLKPDQPFCYGRDYDDAHMKSHADQMTQTIRVFRGQTELASFASSGNPQYWPNDADVSVTVTTKQNAAKATQTYSCQGEGDQWRCSATGGRGGSSCDISQKEIFLRRGANGTMMLANPNSSLPIVDLCSAAAEGKTASDDAVYRLEPMPQSACAP